jgi:hypothetical protein
VRTIPKAGKSVRMARPANSHAKQFVRIFFTLSALFRADSKSTRVRAALVGYLLLLNPTLCLAQRYPFVPAGGAEAPRGLFTLIVDSKQRLWLAGMQTGTEGIFVFDGRQ